MRLEIEIKLPLCVLFPDSMNEIMDRLTEEDGLILKESAGLFYERVKIDKSVIDWSLYLSLPRVSNSFFEKRKQWIIENTPDKVFDYGIHKI